MAVLYAFFVFLTSTHCLSLYEDLEVEKYCNNQDLLCRHANSYHHVVCQYYGKTGPSCSRFREISVDINDAIEIVAQINSIRTQAAKGLAVGKDDEHLPQAYGMMEVFWNSELASIARIMIKQCLDTHKHSCASTENFTDPIMTFMYGSATNKTSDTDDIIENVLAMWNNTSYLTTKNQILDSPDLKGLGFFSADEDDSHKDSTTLFYLKMVTGDLTHVGCAAAVYDLPLLVGPDQVSYGHILCYLSHYTKKNMQVYNTTKPISGTLYTKCGCPPKYRETKACLCVPARSPVKEQQQNQTQTSEYHTSSTAAHYNNKNDYQKYLNEMFNKFQIVMGISTETPRINFTGEELVSLFNEERTTALWEPPPTYFTDIPQVSIIPINATSTSLQKPLVLEPQVSEILQLASQQILGPIVQNNMQVLEPIVQENEQWQLGTQPTPIPEAGVKTPSNCKTEVNCPPRIVMLPVFSLQNVYKQNSRKKSPRYNRRSGNISLVQSADDDFDFSEEDEIPLNMSKLRSKLLQTVRKMRKNELLDFFNQEQNLKTVHPLMDATELNQSNSVPLERNLEPSEHNLEFQKHILEPNLRVQTMIPRSHDGSYEKSKKRAMSLLDQLEQKGRTVKLNSREIVQFDTKMRGIYKTAMSIPDQMQF